MTGYFSTNLCTPRSRYLSATLYPRKDVDTKPPEDVDIQKVGILGLSGSPKKNYGAQQNCDFQKQLVRRASGSL